MLFAPTRVYGSYNLYGSGLRIIARLCVHTRTRRLTGKPGALQIRVRTTIASNSPLTCKYNQVSLIKYNVIILSHPFSASHVSLYKPPLNQLCQDDLPFMFNTPLYQSQVPFTGFHLLNHTGMTYTSTIKCPASYPAFYNLPT